MRREAQRFRFGSRKLGGQTLRATGELRVPLPKLAGLAHEIGPLAGNSDLFET
jgi:hypothetical protein